MVTVSSKQSYVKHHVKRDPQNLEFKVDEKGNPVKGDRIRGARITEDQAKVLNANSLNSGHMWVRDKEDEAKIKADEEAAKKEADAKIKAEKAEKERVKAEKERVKAEKAEKKRKAKEAEEAEKAERTELIEKLEVLVKEGKVEKMPHRLTGIAKLKEIISKVK